MQLTDYHAKYDVHELTKRYPSDSVSKDELIDAEEARLKQNITESALFEIEWSVQ